jgi:hypothetical protein
LLSTEDGRDSFGFLRATEDGLIDGCSFRYDFLLVAEVGSLDVAWEEVCVFLYIKQ